MPHRFVIRANGRLCTFERFADIPQMIEHVIEFSPQVPDPPHTDAQHQEISSWNTKLQELMERERASSD